MMTPGCFLQHWWGTSPPQGQKPFTVLSHHAQDAFLQLSLLSCPLVNDRSSFPHSFIQLLLFNTLIAGLGRPKAPLPSNEKQKDNLTWLFSQLIPTPPHPPQLSQYDSSKTARLCCLSTSAQKGPRYLSVELGKWARCNPRMGFPRFWCPAPLGNEAHKPMARLVSSCANKTSGANSFIALSQPLVLVVMSLNQQQGSNPVLGSQAKVTAKLEEAGSAPW